MATTVEVLRDNGVEIRANGRRQCGDRSAMPEMRLRWSPSNSRKDFHDLPAVGQHLSDGCGRKLLLAENWIQVGGS